jgi:hypothetical protein
MNLRPELQCMVSTATAAGSNGLLNSGKVALAERFAVGILATYPSM